MKSGLCTNLHAPQEQYENFPEIPDARSDDDQRDKPNSEMFCIRGSKGRDFSQKVRSPGKPFSQKLRTNR
jgi:hypothetical protein